MDRAYSVEELATRWGIDPRDVEEELGSGRLAFFTINGKRRITADTVVRFEGQSVPTDGAREGSRVTVGVGFRTSPPFRYRWPNNEVEEFDPAFEALTSHDGFSLRVRIGFGMRRTVGRERRHVVVFLGGRPYGREDRVAGRPVVEFVGVDDYDQTKQVASLVKMAGREVRSVAELPAEYAELEVVPYNSVITGPFAHGGLALVLRDDGLEGMLRHALIRARSMGLVC